MHDAIHPCGRRIHAPRANFVTPDTDSAQHELMTHRFGVGANSLEFLEYRAGNPDEHLDVDGSMMRQARKATVSCIFTGCPLIKLAFADWHTAF